METKPLFTKKVSAGTRVYYLDVCKDSKDQLFLSVSEIPTDRKPGKKERQRVFLHADILERFTESFGEAVDYIRTNGNKR